MLEPYSCVWNVRKQPVPSDTTTASGEESRLHSCSYSQLMHSVCYLVKNTKPDRFFTTLSYLTA